MPSTLLLQDTSDTAHREGPASAAIVQNQQTSTPILVISNYSNWTGGLLLCYSLIPVPPQTMKLPSYLNGPVARKRKYAWNV